jgi:predicted AlkP superfamily pyrophosphatase or phosphodiesterase
MNVSRCLVALGLLVATASAEPPRLAVVVTVDQMRADFLERFRPWFGEGGFKRWLDAGAVYTDCHYQHAITKTAPGHATILSGVSANVHGIIGNEWLDRTTYIQGNAVEDAASPLVGLPPRMGRYFNPAAAAKAGRSPRNFLATTIGDWLKAHYGPQAKAVGVADKDRSAILPVGRHPDGAYWTEEGIFITSAWYKPELPAWVQAFNARRNAEQYFGQTWERLLAPEVYDRVQGPDDAAGEESSAGLPRTFPKRVAGRNPQDGAFWSAFERTPWSNDLVAEMAVAAVDAEQLGQDDIPDLLAVGFSQTDAAGHAYGPDSHEIMDTYLRLDRTIATLFAALDARVGAGRWVAVLTADHGVAPLPERIQAQRGVAAAGRIERLDQHVAAALNEAFGPLPDPLYWILRDNSGYHVNPRALAHKQLALDRVAAEVQAALVKHPTIAAAYTRAQLTGTGPLDAWGEMTRRSYYPERSADVLFVERPNFQSRSLGTTHGTPHDYDTHVPLAWYGAGVAPGTHGEPAGVYDLAPTLAGLLGVTPAPEAHGKKLF